MASFTKELNQRLAKRPLVFNGRLANRWLTSLVKNATLASNRVHQSWVVLYIAHLYWLNYFCT